MVNSMSGSTSAPATAGSARISPSRIQHVHVHVRERAEAAALDEHRLLVEHLAGLEHLPSGPNIAAPLTGRVARASAPSAGCPPLRNSIPLNSIMSISIRPVVSLSSRLSTSFSGSWCMEERAVEQIHPDDAERLLLQRRLGVQHPHVQDDLAGLVARRATGTSRPSSRGTRCRPCSCGRPPCRQRRRTRSSSPRCRPSRSMLSWNSWSSIACRRPRDIAARPAVDRVADRHVVGRHALRHRAGGAADAEEPAHHFLPRADLGERAIPARVQVDLQRLLQGVGSNLHGDHSSPRRPRPESGV